MESMRGRAERPQFWAVVFWSRSKLNLPVYFVIVSVVHAFRFYRRVQERDRRSLELEASLSRAKLQALRLQMQPYFLFNTLNAIGVAVPTLVRQTLVENAIRHGIEPKPGGGRVGIEAWVESGTLRVRVSDEGVGLNSVGALSERRGIGLANTESRLTELYGFNGKLTMRAPESGGVVVDMELPARTISNGPETSHPT